VSRSPDYDVKALRKDTDEKNRVGAAWRNDDGSISIVLDAFIKLEAHPKLILTCFPKLSKKESK
jgi:hypothetical protein